ncbi:hypothetical protein MRX96_013187 [Rhipicephalus microplus]
MNDATRGDKFQALPVVFGTVPEPRQRTAGPSCNVEVRPRTAFHHFRPRYPRLRARRKWTPRYSPLGLFLFVPFLGCCAPEATGSCRRPCGKARRNRRAMTMQFEWDGCTFYRYIPVETKRATGSHMTPAAVIMGATSGGAGPCTPKEPNLSVLHKKNERPTSHINRPPFQAAALSKSPPRHHCLYRDAHART